MANRDEQERFLEEDDYVPVKYARDDEEAEKFKLLLEDHDIDAVIPDDDSHWYDDVAAEGIPILVPAEHLTLAEEVFEDRELLEDELNEQLEEFAGENITDDFEDEFDDLAPDANDPDFIPEDDDDDDFFGLDDDDDDDGDDQYQDDQEGRY